MYFAVNSFSPFSEVYDSGNTKLNVPPVNVSVLPSAFVNVIE